jgi:kynurenine 3-monooxygenase
MGFVAELKFSFRRLRERPGDTGLAIVGLRIGSGLADLAVDNFIEMRDKTASRKFRTKKKLDHLLEGLLPGFYPPLYTMVTFTRIPYAEAARRARRQDRIV